MIYLGKLKLRWCHACNVPVLGDRCGTCGGETEQVRLTPPGDVRPAFLHDRMLLREVIMQQFGAALVPEVVILNDAPAVDRMDEVIFDGRVAGTLRYDIGERGYRFLPRIWYASLLQPERGYVVADKGAVQPILGGENLMAPGVVEVSDDVAEGDELVVYSPEREVIAAGSARMNGDEMRRSRRGMAVKVRRKGTAAPSQLQRPTWDDVLAANAEVMDGVVGEAISFIRSTAGSHDVPLAVSFSGGKDSLATLLLVRDAGYAPPLLFVDTGLEFEETVKHVHDIAEQFDLPLHEEQAGDIFWDTIDFFGPPARDRRWCCKTCKLGPTTRLIDRHFPDGVLSFIGQRRYESMQRSQKGRVWHNPWVEQQTGASPIQHWTALHVWLYLFRKQRDEDVGWNPLYEQGFARIGCWCCPASDLAELELLDRRRWQRFARYLERYADRHGCSDAWLEKGLWRWRQPPDWADDPGEQTLEQELAVEGDDMHVGNMLACLGPVEATEDGWRLGDMSIEAGGGGVEVSPSERAAEVRETVDRALHCTGCGVCVGQCEVGAIGIRDGRAWIDPASCMHCGACSDLCPVVVFGRRGFR
ncbi:MAG: phosphoadenosine phosphosulfate reductase family protein [Thermoplasmatota archaeon]